MKLQYCALSEYIELDEKGFTIRTTVDIEYYSSHIDVARPANREDAFVHIGSQGYEMCGCTHTVFEKVPNQKREEKHWYFKRTITDSK